MPLLNKNLELGIIVVLCFSDFYGLPFAFSRYQTRETRMNGTAHMELLDCFFEKHFWLRHYGVVGVGVGAFYFAREIGWEVDGM